MKKEKIAKRKVKAKKNLRKIRKLVKSRGFAKIKQKTDRKANAIQTSKVENPLGEEKVFANSQSVSTEKKQDFDTALGYLKSGSIPNKVIDIDKELALKRMTIESLKKELGLITQQPVVTQTEKQEEKKPDEPKPFVEKIEKIETDFDRVLKYLKEKRKANFSTISKDLGVDWKLVDECCNILKEEGKADIIYPPFGEPICVWISKE